MVKFTYLTVIAMLFITVAHAQVKTFTIKGSLADSAGKTPLAGARIDLFHINDTLPPYNIVTG